MKIRLVSLLFSSALFACGDEPTQSKESSSIEKKTVVIADVLSGDRAALLQQLRLPMAEVMKGLGPHRFESTLVVKTAIRGKEQISFEQKTLWEVESESVRHLTIENSAGSGYELFQKDDMVVMSNRYGPFLRRDSADTEQLFQDSWETLSTYLSLFPNLSVSKKGNVLVLGKASESPPFSPIDTNSDWRSSARLVEVNGEISLQKKTALPTKAKMALAFQAKQDGKVVDFTVTYTQEFSKIGEEVAVKFPEVSIEQEPRRPSFERMQLLGLPPSSTSAPTKEKAAK